MGTKRNPNPNLTKPYHLTVYCVQGNSKIRCGAKL